MQKHMEQNEEMVREDAEVEASVVAAKKVLESHGYAVLLPLPDGVEYEVNVKSI